MRFRATARLAIALVAVGVLLLVAAATASTPAGASALGPANIGRNPPQVGLTASYSVIGGGGSQAQDLLTYVSNGVQQVVTLTGTPTTYLVDSGTQWSAQTTLNGSTSRERWLTTQDVSGTISAPLTVVLSYYHQYLVTFNFNITKGGTGGSPSVSVNQLGGAVSLPASQPVWVDASSPYSYASLLPGSSSTERWALSAGGSGTVTAAGTVLVTYNHEYLVSSSYSVVGGAGPVPTLSSAVLGSQALIPMTTSTQSMWLDAGAPYSFSSVLTSMTAGERWQGTVLVKTQSGNVLSMNNNGTVNSAISITPVYYHQFLVNVSFNFIGGSLGGLAPPAFSYQSFGSKAAANNNMAVWVDSSTPYTLPETICCTSSPSTERWELNNSTSGTVSRATKISSNYFHQFFDLFSYSIVGQQPPSPSGQPGLTYVAAGNAQQLTLLQTPQGAWGDAGSTYTVTSTLAASGASQRWFALASRGTLTGPTPNNSVVINYNQQYLLTIVGGGLQTQWVNAGNSTTLSTPGVFGRSQGAGYRITSYQIDSGAVSTLSQPATLLSIQLSMNGPHTITFQSVRQFQVTLDAGATAALSSITPPTVPGDNYWYDTESHVQVALNGAFARANGVGQRITSIVVTAQPTKQVNTVGVVQAITTIPIETPISIATTSATQYEVVLNSAASAAFVSITPASTFPNDTFWYDSGAQPVTVTLNAAFGRSAGTGSRITSWQVDSGTSTKVASTDTITVVMKGISSPHFLNATVVTQYQLSIDKAGMSALASMTNPPIPQDTGWYDASSPLGVVMNGIWARAAGTGQRLAGYSINGGSQVAVATSGLVVVLNVTKLASPESVTTSVVTQYQVALDSGGAAALASISSTPIAKDNYWYDSGTPLSVSLNGVWGRTATSGSRLVSYAVNQGPSTTVLSSSPVQVLSTPGLSGPASITAKTAGQYHLTSSPVAWVSVTNSTLQGDTAGWFDSGTAVKAVYNATWNPTPEGSRVSVTSYSIDGGTKTNVARQGIGTFTVAIAMNAAHSVALNSVTQYLLRVVGPGQVTTTPPSQTGDAYFDSGSKVTFTIASASGANSKPGVRELLTSYSLDGGPAIGTNSSGSSASFATPAVVFTKAHLLVFNTVTQYEVVFQFFDSLGKNPVQPSGVQLGIGSATVDVQGQSAWLPNGTSFRVISVTWEGASVGPTPAPSFQLQAAPLNVTLNTRVYQASLKVVDLLGLPVSGAQVSMTLANGTTVTGTTKGDGTFSVAMIPIGTFTARVSSLGASAQIVGDAASNQQAPEGRVALSLISLVAVVALVVAAATIGVVLLRKRKEVREGITV